MIDIKGSGMNFFIDPIWN